ncbi:MAG: hypothetical protein KF860_08000 [Cyclobacteriaceae bacterium]|nr:hypothetical protein [Cyclobacteriaceae bacterium]
MMSLIRVYKDWLITKFIIWLKGSPFHIKVPIDYMILSITISGYLPKNLNALELFGMYGLYVTKHYSKLCQSVELWELDPEFVRYARKFCDKNVNVIQGDSVKAVKEFRLMGKYNLLVIDNPLVSPYGNGLYEHFNVMPEIFDATEEQFILIFNVILVNPKSLYEDYKFNSISDLKNRDIWIRKRMEFYGTPLEKLTPQEYVKLYSTMFEEWGLIVDYSTFLPRNHRVGFLGFALRKKILS